MADQHVPAPLDWTMDLGGRGKQPNRGWLYGPGGVMLAEVEAFGVEGKLLFPRMAPLIDAAPEMLNALIDLYALVSEMGIVPDARYGAITNAAAVISKAEGRADG